MLKYSYIESHATDIHGVLPVSQARIRASRERDHCLRDMCRWKRTETAGFPDRSHPFSVGITCPVCSTITDPDPGPAGILRQTFNGMKHTGKRDGSAVLTIHREGSERPKKSRDLTSRRFGMLTVLSHDRYEKGQHFWRCLCDCGRETIVRQQHLSSGKARSCGCLAEMNLIDPDNQFKGTSIRHIKGQAGERRPTVKSHSGIRGVYLSKGSKWIAQIQFQGRTYHLGTFDNLEDARAAREKAEAELYDTTLREWQKQLAEKKSE